MYLGCTHPESTFILHGEQVAIIGDQVQDVLVDVGERGQHTLLLQPLLTQQAPPRHEQNVEVSRRMHLVLAEGAQCRIKVLNTVDSFAKYL